ncbi:MAG: outer membrane beta-barrel protein [Bradymonadales bacterium]
MLSLTAAGASVSAQELDLRAPLGGGINIGYVGGINVPVGIDIGWRFNPYFGLYLDTSYQYMDIHFLSDGERALGNLHALYVLPTFRIFFYENKILSIYTALGLGLSAIFTEELQDEVSRSKDSSHSFLSAKYQVGVDFHVTSRFWLGFAFSSLHNIYEKRKSEFYYKHNNKLNIEKTTQWFNDTTTTFSILIVASYRFL